MRNLAALCLVAGALQAQSPVQFTAKDATMKLGLLAKPSYEAIGSFSKEGTSQNIFMRQMRLMVGGTLGTDFEYFFETDNANLGKADATTGARNHSSLIIQDAVFTYKITKDIKVDAGLILVPLSHHSTQGATNLASWDYSAFAFQQNTAMGSSVGRDTGVQLRGMVGEKEGNLEFRVGAWQGKRLPATTDRVAARNSLRLAARAQWNFLEAEQGLFNAGTYLGAKRILSVGVGHDRQDDYRATAVDVFMDLPIGQDGVQGQWNHVVWDGKTWLPTVKKQVTDFAELGYRFGSIRLSPMIRYDHKAMDVPTVAEPDETRVGIGLAWWIRGHQSNLKAFYTRVTPSAPQPHTLKAYDQVNLQWQWLLW